MQAIVTRETTDRNGNRIVTAVCAAGRVKVFKNTGSRQDAHHRAAAELIRKLGWTGDWHCGGMPDGGNVYVCTSDGLRLMYPAAIVTDSGERYMAAELGD